MRAFRITCCLLAVLVLSTQAVRHVYVKYFESTGSVLDRFEEKRLETEIEKANSLDELVAKYEPVKKRENELDAMLKEQEKARPEDKREVFRQEFRKTHEKDYSQAYTLRGAITNWESRAKEIRELRVFLAFGYAMFIVGSWLYLRWPWFGMAFIVPGVVEMIWWTSPTLRIYGGAVQEFDRLLNNKLGFTLLSLVLVLAAWFSASRLQNSRTQ